MSYRRVLILLPVPPYNQNSAFILEKNHVKKYVKNLELINKDLQKKKLSRRRILSDTMAKGITTRVVNIPVKRRLFHEASSPELKSFCYSRFSVCLVRACTYTRGTMCPVSGFEVKRGGRSERRETHR